MGVLSDVLSRENNLHFWSLTLNFTIFDGLENLEERKKISSDLSTKKQNQQITPACARDLLISTDQGSCENQQITRFVEFNESNEQEEKHKKNKQQAVVVVKNSVTNEDLESEIDQVMAGVGPEVKNRAAYRAGIKKNKLRANAAVEAADVTKQVDAQSVCEGNLDRIGQVYGPAGFICSVSRGDLGLFKNAAGGIFLAKESARIWQKIDEGELDFRPFTQP